MRYALKCDDDLLLNSGRDLRNARCDLTGKEVVEKGKVLTFDCLMTSPIVLLPACIRPPPVN